MYASSIINNCFGNSAKFISKFKSNSKLIRNSKIKTRLIAAFIILSIVPLTTVGVISYLLSSGAINIKIKTYSEQVMNQLGKNIELELEKYANYANEITFDKTIQEKISDV